MRLTTSGSPARRGDSGLDFSAITPVAGEALGGLVRDHFSNGRMFATLAWHGGLVNLSYWGKQHLGAARFFNCGLESAWLKMFRAYVGVGTKRYYLPLKNTELFPFGIRSEAFVRGVRFQQELLLLPDALVQRFNILQNPKKQPVCIEMFHQEKICRVSQGQRTWTPFEFDAKANAAICTCTDLQPASTQGPTSALAQQGLSFVPLDVEKAVTWIGVGCDVPTTVRSSHNGFKLYFTSEAVKKRGVTFFVAFATGEEQLRERLAGLSKNVHRECDAVIDGYEKRLVNRPRIDVGNPILNSAFGQYPEVIEAIKVADRPGAVRATQSGYFVWGWDGMTPLISSALSNEASYTASILRFFQETWHPEIGIAHLLTTAFTPKLRGPFASQAQYIAGLYHYVATTGDLAVAKKMMPTCRNILDLCRKHSVGDSGLVSGNALWPDFPEAMEEDGNDLSSMNNSALYQGLRSMEYLAAAIEDDALAAECRDWAQRLRESFIRYFYDDEKGFFVTSCSSKDFSRRHHYGCQTIFWLTPFARELVAHDPGRIANFLTTELRSAKCLLSLPQWDTAWMNDGNQLGSSFPIADYFFLNVHKLIGDASALDTWMKDVEWFWRFHTAPEAFTPEAENEDEFGPDNHGCKQMQALTSWYASAYTGIAGMDFDHEGITFTPWGNTPVNIRELRLRKTTVDLKIRGAGGHIRSLKLNGKPLPAGSRKLSWNQLTGKRSRIELVRTDRIPAHPVIVRADGLQIVSVDNKRGRLSANIDGAITGEVVVQVTPRAVVAINGVVMKPVREKSTGSVTIPFQPNARMKIDVYNSKPR